MESASSAVPGTGGASRSVPPAGMEQDVQHTPTPAPAPGTSPGCFGCRVGPRALVSVTGAAGSGSPRSAEWVGAYALPEGRLGHYSPWLVWGGQRKTSPGAGGAAELQARAGAQLIPVLSSGALWHFVPWQGHRVAGGGWCQLLRSSLSIGLQCTSAGLGNNKLQQGLLLMFKKTEAK